MMHPERYHGFGKRPPFFEGWYFKLVDASLAHRFAVIPGVFLDPKGSDSYCFVQFLDGAAAATSFHRYPLEQFEASRHDFDIRVGPNHFHLNGLCLDVDDETGRLRGEVALTGLHPWPVTLTSPGAMGWYAWLPFMETYHGILSLDHGITGTLDVNGASVRLDGGRGYTEKDWGRSFPSAWVWMQTNHFHQPGTSLTLSVAMIPRVGRTFRGFIAGLLHAGRLYKFATYTGAKIDHLSVTGEKVELSLGDGRHRLDLVARGGAAGILYGPTVEDFRPRVRESLSATIEVRLSELQDGLPREVFSGVGEAAGLEVNGDLRRLLSG